MGARKRGHEELEASAPAQPASRLHRLRNMWQFANLFQFLFTFGKAIKLEDEVDIEDLEQECLKPGHSARLSEIGLALLKFVSSHRGLTPDLFDEYARRQYQAKAPTRNPFGDDEVPRAFVEFDIFTKINVLWQLSQWTLSYSERLRERMPEQKETEQTYWRVEPIGWDSQDRTYLVLDDNRLYRQTDAPLPVPTPTPTPKKNSKKAKAAARASKRRRQSTPEADDKGDEENGVANGVHEDLLGGRQWECIAVTLDDYRSFLAKLARTRDADEKILIQQITQHILPVVERAEEALQRKAAKRHRELLNLEKLATAKRSSRIAGKAEKQKEVEEAAEAERKQRVDEEMALRGQEKMRKMEQEREHRIATREQRVRERETRRILHEEELASLSEDGKKIEGGQGRMSERHLKAEMEKRKKALEELAQEDEWVFDCSGCGLHGENLVSLPPRRMAPCDRGQHLTTGQDDGTGIIACEKCTVWQHLACLHLRPDAAEQADFHFVCALCQRRVADREKQAKHPLKLDFRKLGASVSPPTDMTGAGGKNGDHRAPKAQNSNSAWSTATPTPPPPQARGPTHNGPVAATFFTSSTHHKPPSATIPPQPIRPLNGHLAPSTPTVSQWDPAPPTNTASPLRAPPIGLAQSISADATRPIQPTVPRAQEDVVGADVTLTNAGAALTAATSRAPVPASQPRPLPALSRDPEHSMLEPKQSTHPPAEATSAGVHWPTLSPTHWNKEHLPSAAPTVGISPNGAPAPSATRSDHLEGKPTSSSLSSPPPPLSSTLWSTVSDSLRGPPAVGRPPAAPAPLPGLSPIKPSPSSTTSHHQPRDPLILAPGPALSPSPRAIDLTPPSKAPTPDQRQPNGDGGRQA
ncbi:MAG: hypothetical protein M1838_003248 [Thelocarpon superellum]|nr:MAG: hypothetical protein M1838_003248 [Thelocarpon superellum]